MHLYHGRANAIHPYNNLLTQNKDFLCNPVNPDSKPNCKLPKPQTHTLQQQ